ncbi:cysteine--tRNA ligase [Candidatus Saccharibacteria bacterium]|nr:cysteine--tRNA ligase [Candidatus Saccharibacteria bacterium]
MRLYNTLTKKLETFKPLNPDEVKIYTCGPTVYDFPHVGNYTSYIYWDLLIRTLKKNGFTPKRVLNLTDVGHLASDADEGEDKLEKGAKRENKTVWEIADFYSNYFLENYEKLNLTPPDVLAKATDYIEEDIKLIDALTKKGYTYETSDGIYFDTSKFKTYADFARLDLDHLKAGARVDFNSEKKNVSDFALWKFIKPDEDHAMRWDYLDRPGYPGWHIECATIIHEELGETIDIHTGGIDHIPVHHTNEIAESEAAFDKKMCNFWLHCNFITINNEKVSKSLGNTYKLEELEEKGFAPLDFKMWVLQGHFQGTRNFSFDDLSAAKSRRLNWRNKAASAFQTGKTEKQPDLQEKILNALNENLNSPEAFSIIDTNELSFEDWQFVDELFALDLVNNIELPDFIKRLISERKEARDHKDYALSDQIRDELSENNIVVLDTKDGPIWQFLN